MKLRVSILFGVIMTFFFKDQALKKVISDIYSENAIRWYKLNIK